MDRREFLQKGAVASVAVAVEPMAHAGNKAPAKKPNVLYVFSDQHRAFSLPGQPFNQAMAPNLDNFRHSNFSMETCISNYPLCTPYRGIFMSGRWPCETGLTHNGVALKASEVGLGETFRKNGYHTGYIGKWHLSGGHEGPFVAKGPLRFGFEHWQVWGDTNNHYHSFTFNPDTGEKISPEGYNATVMTDETIDFLHKQEKDKPWMLVVSWNPPHPPFNPPEEDANLYNAADLKLRPNVQLLPAGTKVEGPRANLASADRLRKAERGYYGAITAVDKEFARILKALDDTGQADNTIVIYTSDHGEMMGSHGHMGKQMPHEEANHVPFFVRYPGVTPKGAKSNTLFSAIDIYPTLCGLAGIPVPPHCRGRDLSDVMRGKRVEPTEAIMLMNETGPAGSPESPQPGYRGARTQTHTYAVQADGRWCLYDNMADPYQMKNLVKDPEYAPLMDRLDKMILEWMKSTHDPFPFKEALTKFTAYPG